jgi:hypothetical protein
MLLLGNFTELIFPIEYRRLEKEEILGIPWEKTGAKGMHWAKVIEKIKNAICEKGKLAPVLYREGNGYKKHLTFKVVVWSQGEVAAENNCKENRLLFLNFYGKEKLN